MTLMCAYKCVVVSGSVSQRGLSGDGSSSILFKYECNARHLFVLGWARIKLVTMGSVVSE